MKYYGPKKFLAAAFVLTLGLKWLLYHGEPAADPELGEAVKSFLLEHGFDSHLEKRFDQVLVYANAGKCRILISEAAPQGWNRSSIEIWAKPVGRLTYVFDGALHEHEPFLGPVVDEYWTRMRFKMGLSPSRHPVLAVAASDECTINALPWWKLSTLS